jgi:succinate dehydrogenase/fumarate reductase cytochrome b subunit
MYINTISAVILVSLLFIDNLSSEKAIASLSLPVTNDSNSLTTTTGVLTNTTNATNAISENVTGKLENTTSALENATAALTNATEALQNISSISAAARPLSTTTANATAVNATTVISSIFDNNLPALFIIVIFLIIIIPLVFDMFLAYRKKPKDSTDKENNRVVGMPGLYRSLMTFGIIVLVGTVIFYLLALITLNINNSTSPVLQSLIDILKSLGTILGTALATIIAFYFGMRGAESATEKAAAATKQASKKVPPKVLNTIPADGATEVPVTSLVSATFSEPMSSPTINANTFTVKKEDETSPITGILSLSSDGKTAIFDSTQDFSPNTKYVAAIDIGAEDLAGNALVSAKRWSFTTTKN